MRIKITLLLTAIFIIGLTIYLNKRSLDINASEFLQPKASSFNQKNPTSINSLASNFNSGILNSQAVDDKGFPSTEFLNWFNEQLSGFDKISTNKDFNEDAYRKKSASLEVSEQIYLVKTILTPQGPANSKILSAYILGLETEHNFEAISYVLSQELSIRSGPVHSPEETLSMQEKAIRRMLIDSSIQDFKIGRISENELIESFNKIPDQGLRAYALSRFAEVSK